MFKLKILTTRLQSVKQQFAVKIYVFRNKKLWNDIKKFEYNFYDKSAWKLPAFNLEYLVKAWEKIGFISSQLTIIKF